MRSLLFVLLATLSLSTIVSCGDNSVEVINGPNTETNDSLSYSKEVFDGINDYRVKNSLEPLIWSDTIYSIAYVHSKNMASGVVEFGHDGFDNRYKLVKEATGANSIAENVAMTYKTKEAVIAGWTASEGHKKNIEGDYKQSAVAVVFLNGRPFYTQIFAK